MENKSRTTKDSIEYRTKDLNEAAFLWCQDGVKLLKLQGSEGTHRGITIHFLLLLPWSDQRLHELQLQHANNECVVEPNSFTDKQAKLRDLLHGSLGIKHKDNTRGKTI